MIRFASEIMALLVIDKEYLRGQHISLGENNINRK